MGRRLSFRKKNIQSEEFCLGKLYYYIDTKEEAESCESIKYLLDLGALYGVFGDFEDDLYDFDGSDAERFAEICSFCPYQDYGEFFELTKAQARKFIELYAYDKARLYGGDENTAKDQIARALAFMDRQSSLDTSIFEFRLGA